MNPLSILLIGTLIVLGGILFLRMHAFLALTLAALAVAAITPEEAVRDYWLGEGKSREEAVKLSRQTAGERVAKRFGGTCGDIGILIAMAAIIGKCLMESGAADRIVRTFLRALGEARAALAFLGSGFLLGIPVFFDTVFYLMIPLGKAMGFRTGRNFLLYVLSITAGATMTHSLVPPTPGPLFVASRFQVDIGTMILGGFIIGIFTSAAGYIYAVLVNRRWQVPLRDSADLSLENLEELARRDDSRLPPFWLSIAPILLPVALIGGRTVLGSLTRGDGADPPPGWLAALESPAAFLGNKNIALAIAALIAIGILLRHRDQSRGSLGKAIEAALASSGMIILITAAGGAFGGALQETSIGAWIRGMFDGHRMAVLPLAFLVTVLIRTAQGSATVAMITAAGILSGMADPAQLGFHPLYLALAVGCGSKPIHWMNDSGFWVICKMSGFTEGETLRYVTPMTAIMGAVGLAAVMAGAKLFPLV